MGARKDTKPKPAAKTKSSSKSKKVDDEVAAREKQEMVEGQPAKKSAVLETAVVTGVLASQEAAMDVKIMQFSMSVYGKEFIMDTKLELNFGRQT